MWMNTVEMRTPPPKHNTMPENIQVVVLYNEQHNSRNGKSKVGQTCIECTLLLSSIDTCVGLMEHLISHTHTYL